MAILRYPPELPGPQSRGYQEDWPDPVLRTSMEVGPAKYRRRFTTMPETLEFTLRLTRDQLELLRHWLDETLEGGALPFVWAHPRTGKSAQFRFASKPGSPSPVARGVLWDITVQLERLP